MAFSPLVFLNDHRSVILQVVLFPDPCFCVSVLEGVPKNNCCRVSVYKKQQWPSKKTT